MKKELERFEARYQELVDNRKSKLKSLNAYLHEYLEIEKLNFDFDAVGQIEKFYLDVKSKKIELEISPEEFKNLLIVYIGEAIIHYGGGSWELDKHPKSVSYGEAVINGWGASSGRQKPQIPPSTWLYLLEKDNKVGTITELLKRIAK